MTALSPPPAWGHHDLTQLVRAARAGHDLGVMAKAQSLTRAEIDQALWAKLGRSIPDACDILNSAKGRAA